jgi:hypothetical protein
LTKIPKISSLKIRQGVLAFLFFAEGRRQESDYRREKND